MALGVQEFRRLVDAHALQLLVGEGEGVRLQEQAQIGRAHVGEYGLGDIVAVGGGGSGVVGDGGVD